MSYSGAKTALDARIQAENTASEIEADGHKIRKRSVGEIVQLSDLINSGEDEETNGDSPLRQAGFRISMKNNGSLI